MIRINDIIWNDTPAELRAEAAAMADPRDAQRFLAIASLAEGRSVAEVARETGRNIPVIRSWLHDYLANGKAFFRQSGRWRGVGIREAFHMTDQQKLQARDWLIAHPKCTVSEFQAEIKRAFDLTCSWAIAGRRRKALLSASFPDLMAAQKTGRAHILTAEQETELSAWLLSHPGVQQKVVREHIRMTYGILFAGMTIRFLLERLGFPYKRFLKPEQRALFEAWLAAAQPARTVVEAIAYVGENFGITYSQPGMKKFGKRLGYRFSLPSARGRPTGSLNLNR